ncbi:MAG: two-component regulator propeller domain-containing protein, partial [Acidobacteriota bacterium]
MNARALSTIRRLILPVFGLLILSAPARGSEVAPSLDPSKRISQYVLDVWKTEDGLPSNQIRAISQTPEGYLWLTTPAGLARFDGIDFRVFNMESTPVFASENFGPMALGADGSLWIGSLGAGLYRYQAGRFVRYTTNRDLGNSVTALVTDRTGTLWVATQDGLYRFADGGLQPVEIPGDRPIGITALAEDPAGDLWIATRSQQVRIFRRRDGEVQPELAELSAEIDLASQIHRTAEGLLWLGTSQGLYQVDGSAVTRYTQREGLAFDVVRQLYEDRGGSLWVGTDDGLNRIRGGRIESFTTADGLPDGRLRSLFEDREGNLWLGSYSGGLVRLKEGAVTAYTVGEGLAHNFVWSVVEDGDKNLWIGTSRGLNRMVRSAHEPAIVPVLPEVGSSVVFSVLLDTEGATWAGTTRGLVRSSPAGLRRYTEADGLSNDLVKVVYEDPRAPGTIWVGTQNGLNRYRNEAVTAITGVPGTVHDILRAHSGSLWVTTATGLFRLVGEDSTSYTTADGLLSNSFRSLYEDDAGTLWIGSHGGGLVRYREGEFTSFTARSGLLTNDVWSILEDYAGRLWLSNDSGIQRLAKQDLESYAAGRLASLPVRRYGKADGMKNIECNSQDAPAGWESADGALWFATMRGVVAIDPRRDARPSPAPSVVIEGFTVDGAVLDPQTVLDQQTVLDEQTLANPQAEVRLQPEDRDLEIRYTAL